MINTPDRGILLYTPPALFLVLVTWQSSGESDVSGSFPAESRLFECREQDEIFWPDQNPTEKLQILPELPEPPTLHHRCCSGAQSRPASTPSPGTTRCEVSTNLFAQWGRNSTLCRLVRLDVNPVFASDFVIHDEGAPGLMWQSCRWAGAHGRWDLVYVWETVHFNQHYCKHELAQRLVSIWPVSTLKLI